MSFEKVRVRLGKWYVGYGKVLVFLRMVWY